MDLIGLNIDEGASNKILAFIKELLNQPRWLITLLLITIFGGLTYFGFQYFQDRKDYLQLKEQIESINNKFDNSLSYEEFRQYIIYEISEINLLKYQEQQTLNENINLLNTFIYFVQHEHPNNKIVNDLKAVQSRMQLNYDMYIMQSDYVIEQLNQNVKK